MNLDPDSLSRRFQDAPDWVRLRHDRSYRSRLAIGENIQRLTDLRDTLRVCARYDAARHRGPSFPEWLGIMTDRVDLSRCLDDVMVGAELNPGTWYPTSHDPKAEPD